MSRQWLIFASGISLLLSACATKPPDPVLAASGTYQSGYDDGCHTSTARSKIFDNTVVRDDASYANDPLYKQGWNKGFRDCGSAATRSDPTAEPVPQWQKTGGPLGN